LRLIVVTTHFWAEVGVGNAAMELTKELLKLGVELIAVIHGDRVTRAQRLNCAHEFGLDKQSICIEVKNNSLLIPLRPYLLSKRAAKSLKSLQKDYGKDCVVHSHSLYPSAFLKNRNTERNATFVTTLHGTFQGELERFRKEMPFHPLELRYRLATYSTAYFARSLLRRSKDHFIAVSPRTAYEITRLGLPKPRVHVIPNGVNFALFKPHNREEARKKLGLPMDKLIVLTINYIAPRKGLHTLIKASRTVINDEPDAYFVIVGGVGNTFRWYMTYLRNLLDKFRVRNHFKFVGFVPKEELPLYMNAADMFTLTSYAEGAPLVVPQALACKRLVVATHSAAGGYLPRNLVAHNGNVDEIAQKISFYLSSVKERNLIAEELYQKAVNEFSWASIAKKTIELYQKIMVDNSALHA